MIEPDFKPRFPIGTKFLTRGAHPRECTVTDWLVTRNSAGFIVKVRYVAQHQFLGQIIQDSDVPETTIAMGILTDA